MPIEDEFNPFEDTIFGRPIETTERFTITPDMWTTATASVQQQIVQRQLDEIRTSRSLGVTQVHTMKKPKQKPLAKLLDEVAEANKDVFDRVNKIQEEINALEKVKLIELADKYDTLLFSIIGKNYTLVKATEKTKSGYYNTLIQQLNSTIHGATNGNEYTLEDFKQVMLRHVSRFTLLDDLIIARFYLLFEELYEYYNLIKEKKKKEKKCLMGRDEKKVTVCEDYINSGRGRDRFSVSIY